MDACDAFAHMIQTENKQLRHDDPRDCQLMVMALVDDNTSSTATTQIHRFNKKMCVNNNNKIVRRVTETQPADSCLLYIYCVLQKYSAIFIVSCVGYKSKHGESLSSKCLSVVIAKASQKKKKHILLYSLSFPLFVANSFILDNRARFLVHYK